MRRVLRGAVPLLAAALGFARPASAQIVVPSDPAPTIFADADDEVAPPPRVVPHHRIVLEPIQEAVDADAPATRPAHAPVAPSGLPGAAPAPSSTAAKTPAAPQPRIAAAPPPHAWPAAFLVGKEPEITEVKQTAHSETTDDLAPPPWEDAKAPAGADVRRRIEAAAYGRQVTGMAAETQANGVVVVRVRLRGAAADPSRGKVVELPQAPGSGVRVLLEVER